ncbi:MAG: hypothetical protein ACYSWU_14015, partial [Planctomycetota bacterium]
MRAVDLADGKEVLDVDRLPPVIAGQPAVVVLGTDGDLERLGRDVDLALGIELDRAGVHRPQAFDGRI